MRPRGGPRFTAEYLRSVTTPNQQRKHKVEIRARARAARKEQADKESISRKITGRLTELHEYRNAKCVMWYLDVGDEVQTQHCIPDALSSGRSIVVPYCAGPELQLFRLESPSELEVGAHMFELPALPTLQQVKLLALYR